MIQLQSGDCFTRRGAFLSLTPDQPGPDGIIWSMGIGRLCSDASADDRWRTVGVNLFSLFLTGQEGDIGFTAQCFPEVMRLVGEDGLLAEICFPSPDIIRIRTQRCGLRFYGKLKEHEAAIDRLDGSIQLGFFDAIGEVLFFRVRGGGHLLSPWKWTVAGTDEIDLRFICDVERTADICLRYGNANVEKPKHMPPFDVCVHSVREEYERWRLAFPNPPAGYEEEHAAAVWHAWNCLAVGMGKLTHEIPMAAIRAGVDFTGAAFCAAAMTGNLGQAAEMIGSILFYRSDHGRLPWYMDDLFRNDLYMLPPYYALALDRLSSYDLGKPVPHGEESLYFATKACLGWWQRSEEAMSSPVWLILLLIMLRWLITEAARLGQTADAMEYETMRTAYQASLPSLPPDADPESVLEEYLHMRAADRETTAFVMYVCHMTGCDHLGRRLALKLLRNYVPAPLGEQTLLVDSAAFLLAESLYGSLIKEASIR